MATVEQLRDLARERELEGTSNMNKADLLAALGFEDEDAADAYLEANPDGVTTTNVTETQDGALVDDDGSVVAATTRGLRRTRATRITTSTNRNGTVVAQVEAVE